MTRSVTGQGRPYLHLAIDPRAGRPVRVLCVALSACLALVVATVGFVYYDFATDLRANTLDISSLGAPSISQSSAEQALPDSFQGRAVNILFVGIDSRYGQNSNNYGDPDSIQGVRSDATIVMHLNADRTSLQAVSIPRDLMTDIPACARSDGTVSEPTFAQFNSAMTIGANYADDVAGGIACTKATVENLTGLVMDAFAVIDFSGFITMVNALGGVWLDLAEPVYDERASLDLPSGCQLLDGNQALAISRARYNLADGTDLSRIDRQHEVLAALLRQLEDKIDASDIPALLTFIKQSLAAVQVSENLADINRDAGLLLSLKNLKQTGIHFLTMPWSPWSEDVNRVVPDEPRATELWKTLAADQPYSPDSPDSSDPEAGESSQPNDSPSTSEVAEHQDAEPPQSPIVTEHESCPPQQ